MLIDSRELGGAIAVVTSFTKRKKMASSSQGKYCNLCRSQITDMQNLQTLSTSHSAMGALDGLIADVSLGVSRMQLLLSRQVCRKCYQNFEKLDKARATVSQLTATDLILESFYRKMSNTTGKQP